MQITKDHKTKIDQIIEEMTCEKDFECYSSNFTNLPKVRKIGKLLECPKENPNCEFAMPFGFGHFCRCPLMNYIQKNIIQ